MKLLSDKTARTLLEMMQWWRDRPPEQPRGKNRKHPVEYAMFKLTTDNGSDEFEADEVARNTNTNAWDTLTNGRTVDIYVEGGGAVGDIVRAFPSYDTDGDGLWLAVSGGTGVFHVKITAVTSDSTYTGRLINNDTDKTEVTGTNITVKALRHTDGSFPVNTIVDCYFDSANSVYCPINYNYFYG